MLSNLTVRHLSTALLAALFGMLIALLSTCTVAVAFSAEESPVEVPPYVINPGAKLPINVFPSVDYLTAFGHFPYPICGLYTRGSEHPAIFIVGPWSESAAELLHEYEHFLEDSMPDQAPRLRDLFHHVTTDDFNIDAFDLEGPVEVKP